MTKQKGFTLVELAIVLMIIGLLIGGVLRGQEMMQNARLQSIIKQVTSYEGALNTFVDMYAMKPGDMTNATVRIPGCNSNNHCTDGNGDGQVGVSHYVMERGDQDIIQEGAQFWKQLALTHIISGIDPSTNVVEWGKSHPATAIGGGMTVVTVQAPPGFQSTWSGWGHPGTLTLRMHGSLQGNAESTPVISPKEAAYIDKKMDDGSPLTGDVQGNREGYDAACEAAYDTSREDKICELQFTLAK